MQMVSVAVNNMSMLSFCPGQASYGYGSQACAALCPMRCHAGLPGLTIGWGPVANIGVAVERDTALVSTVSIIASVLDTFAL